MVIDDTVAFMQYGIHYSPSEAPTSSLNDKIGIEVQPPLSPEAAAGVVNELTRIEKGFNNDGAAAAESASVTRQDEEGTAIVVSGPNRYRGLNDPKELALLIGTTINPCGIHRINYHGHDIPHSR